MSALLTLIGANKWIQYAIIAITGITLVAVIHARVKATGAKEQKLRALEEQLKRTQVNAKLRADIERLSTDDARRRLQQRWSKR